MRQINELNGFFFLSDIVIGVVDVFFFFVKSEVDILAHYLLLFLFIF